MTTHDAHPPSNAAVAWSAHRYGLSPSLAEPDDALLVGISDADDIEDALLALLDDPNRWVVAHVLLTRRAHLKHEMFPTWNGLKIDVSADGTVHIDAAQRFVLRRRWQAWAAADPRLDELPPDPEEATS